MSGPQNKKIYWISFAQIFSMMLIVLSHSVPDHMTAPAWMTQSVVFLQRAGLVTFMWVSAFLAIHTSALEKYGYLSFMKKRAFRLILPYFACSLLMLFPKLIIQSTTGDASLSLNVARILYQLISPRDGILPHLWFLPTLFLLAALIPIATFSFRKKYCIGIAFIVVFAMQFMPRITDIFCVNDIFLYALWYYLGLFAAKIELVRTKKIIIGPTLLSIIFGLSYCALYGLDVRGSFSFVIYGLFALPMILAVALAWGNKFAGFCDKFGRFTYPIYIMSLPIQNIVGILALKINLNVTITYILLFIAGIVFSYIAAKCIAFIASRSYWRWVGYIVGI